MIRVTSTQFFRLQLESMRRAGKDAFAAQAVASSGRRLNVASDDPVGAQQSILLRSLRSDLDTAREKINLVTSELGVQEEALASMTDTVSRLRELAVQMASDSMSAGERLNASIEVTELKKSLIVKGNTRLGDKRLFAGQQTGTDPFDALGNYLGDATAVNVSLPQGATVQVTIRGDDVLRGASGGPDIIQEVDNFIVALNTNNVAGIQNAVDQMAQGVDLLVAQRSQVGSRMQLSQNLDTYFSTLEGGLTQEISRVEDADAVEAFTELNRTQQAFEAAMQVSAASRQPNVFEILF
ncbi:MAG TPA: hypothetical protein DIU15_00765 [Deltaproteobacteria bacterium]|mgnify:CR=1 FL=1|nr:hypothetical protein [Deltaproteobacteria bacterium]HCP44560.1 hypothetical protein [Deltaproteobacteria bacterium]